MAFDFTIGKFVNGEGLLGALANVRQPLDRWAYSQEQRNVTAFSIGGHTNHGGQAWKPWSANYAPVARARGQTHVLVHTGALRDSIHHEVVVQGGDQIEVWVGSMYWLAKVHHEGRGNLPSRPVVFLSESDISRRDSIVRSDIEQELNGQLVSPSPYAG